MKRTLLLDSDILAFQFASSAEEPIQWENELWTLHADGGKAKVQLSNHIDALMRTLKADDCIVALSCPTRRYWRHDILPSYKHGRDTRKPMILGDLKDYLAGNYNSYVRPGLEADDILGILATHPTLVKGEKVIVSEDKDMKTIPGLLYRQGKLETITEDQADYNHLYQALVGDATDGYSGLPGCGPKKAEKILDCSKQEMWPAVVAAYEKAGFGEEEALTQAQVARICRAADYDFEKKEVKLWQPPQA